MKLKETYQISIFPTGMYPCAADADYGKGRGMFTLDDEDFG